MRGYYFITDAALSRAGNERDVENAVKAGVAAVQYRSKGGSARQMVEEAGRLRALCKDALFLVNDSIDEALADEADGVHIGQDDMPLPLARRLLGRTKTIGVTVHSVEEARAAQEEGTDYVAISPVFSTTTKSDAGKAVGLALVSKVKSLVTVPVIAIGGITLENVAEVIAAGADAVCAISCVVTARSVAAEVGKFNRAFQRCAEPEIRP